MIKIENLNYEIEGKILYQNCTIDIDNGKYQLIGNNGVGKTTLFELICGNKKNIIGQIQTNLSCQYIKQETELLEDLTVTQNVQFLNQKYSADVLAILKSNQIPCSNKINRLSGGQKQLVYLLICLLSDFDLYIIDEPFNNLDKAKHNVIRKLIIEKENLIIIDHLNTFSFNKLKVQNRGIICAD